MNVKNQEPVELSVKSLFQDGQYIIPIYQRNYVWGKAEIEQLLQDLMDAAHQSEQKDYYLGSLVVHQRQDGQFEIIDGQQRHTTLSVLMAVLKNLNKHNLIAQQTNLAFEHRSLSSKTLQHLFEKGATGNEKDLEYAMVYAYDMAKKFLSDTNNLKIELEKFAEYLAEHAILLRVIVPADTDLNHYFEIMNSRGEQLEKHEVLKARLMNGLLLPAERTAFDKIWTACSDMSRYVQMGFSAKKESNATQSERVKVFGEDWNKLPEYFDVLVTRISGESEKDSGQTLADVLKIPEFKDKKESATEDGKFGSVINFPNFLLQVLAVQYPDSEISLDDKKLLESFEQHSKYQENLSQFAKDFIAALLQIRFLFDKWVIKSNANEDGHWHLRIIKPSTEKSGYSFVNSVPTDADDKINKQLIMMLSMRHVSFPSQNYKQWLFEALQHLYGSMESDINGTRYLAFLEDKSDEYFNKGCKDDNALHKGTSVPHFFFNHLDYLLWKKIVINKEKLRLGGDADKVKELESLASNFKFTFRSSVEHYFPQNPDSGEHMENCDRFGNLCLISHSNNSRYSNLDVAAKKSHRKNSHANESLKQIIMMSYAEWGPSEQGLKNIQVHEEEMIAILKSTTQ